MLKKSKIYLKSLSSGILLVIMMAANSAIAVNGYIPLDKKHIRLTDGREIISLRTGDHSHQIVLRKGKKVLWKKNFEEEYDRLWDHAFFIPIKKGHYSYDLNHDGILKIAIATWDGGNAMDYRTALIFTVKQNSLEYYSFKKFNLEYGRYVYP